MSHASWVTLCGKAMRVSLFLCFLFFERYFLLVAVWLHVFQYTVLHFYFVYSYPARLSDTDYFSLHFIKKCKVPCTSLGDAHILHNQMLKVYIISEFMHKRLKEELGYISAQNLLGLVKETTADNRTLTLVSWVSCMWSSTQSQTPTLVVFSQFGK